LKFGEISQYVQHRLHVSGAKVLLLQHCGAVGEYLSTARVFRAGKCRLRQCLLAGYVQQRDTIDFGMVAWPSANSKEESDYELINDALKRARQSIQRKTPNTAPVEAPAMTPLQPVYPEPRLRAVLDCHIKVGSSRAAGNRREWR